MIPPSQRDWPDEQREQWYGVVLYNPEEGQQPTTFTFRSGSSQVSNLGCQWGVQSTDSQLGFGINHPCKSTASLVINIIKKRWQLINKPFLSVSLENLQNSGGISGSKNDKFSAKQSLLSSSGYNVEEKPQLRQVTLGFFGEHSD